MSNYICLRCGHGSKKDETGKVRLWIGRMKRKPLQCPVCHSPGWETVSKFKLEHTGLNGGENNCK